MSEPRRSKRIRAHLVSNTLQRIQQKRGLVRLAWDKVPDGMEEAVAEAIELADSVHDLAVREATEALVNHLIGTRFFVSVSDVNPDQHVGCAQFLDFPIVQVQIEGRMYHIGEGRHQFEPRY